MYFLLRTVWTVNDFLGLILELKPRTVQGAGWMVAILLKEMSISGICIRPKTSLTVRTVHTTVYVVSYVV